MVCSVSTSHRELQGCGDLAKSFSETGSAGDGLSEEFRKLGGLKRSEIQTTSAPGHTSWKKVVYVRLGLWKDATSPRVYYLT